MTFLRNYLILALLLGAATIARADDWTFYSASVCNKGKLGFSVAVVTFAPGTFGDDWSVNGWTNIEPSECKNVYSYKAWADAERWRWRRPVLHLAFAFRDSTGAVGPVTLKIASSEQGAKQSNLKFCGSMDRFDYPRPPTTSCSGSQILIPASVDFDPAPMVVQGAWGKTYSMDVALSSEDRIDGNSGSSNAGSKSGNNSGSSASSDSSGPSAATVAGALLGLAVAAAILSDSEKPPKPFESGTLNASLIWKKIVRRSGQDAKWYYEDGSRVSSVYRLDGKTNSYLFDGPEQHPVTDPQVVEVQKALRQALGTWSGYRATEVFSQGRFFYSFENNEHEHRVRKDLTTLGTLDFARARRSDRGDGLAAYEIPCKGDQACVIGFDEDRAGHRSDNDVSSTFYIYFQDSNATSVWNALAQLHKFYPAEPQVTAR